MPEPITRTILERFDVPHSSYETVVMLVAMEPHVDSGLHTHPGFDAAYLLEGGLTVLNADNRTNQSAPVILARSPGFSSRGQDRGPGHEGARHLRGGERQALGHALAAAIN